jgi:predicted metal-dependent HD superfamily phosphohydrolase
MIQTPAEFFATVLPYESKYEILSKMTHPVRFYHNLQHAFDLANDAFCRNDANWRFHYYAAFFHDVIYIPGRKDNEAKSAECFWNQIGQENMYSTLNIAIQDCILFTANHFAPEAYEVENMIGEFLDADLSGLGADESVYALNTMKLKLEFVFSGDYSEEEFRVGRAKFLNMALAVPKIFRTDTYRHLEKNARSNMLKELLSLGG